MTAATATPTATKTATVQSVGIGALVVVEAPVTMRTVLGSCVGIAIYDLKHHIAGLAHSILPEATAETKEEGKFADQAVDNLIKHLKAKGANVSRLTAKLAGGAAMFGHATSCRLGDRNVEVARQKLKSYGIPILAEAVGGTKGRKMYVDPATGAAVVEIIGESPREM